MNYKTRKKIIDMTLLIVILFFVGVLICVTSQCSGKEELAQLNIELNDANKLINTLKDEIAINEKELSKVKKRYDSLLGDSELLLTTAEDQDKQIEGLDSRIEYLELNIQRLGVLVKKVADWMSYEGDIINEIDEIFIMLPEQEE